MLTVNLHLCTGDVITTTMTPSQKNRLSRTLNQTVLPVTPFAVESEGTALEIPWRSIGYISVHPQVGAEQRSAEAAD